MDARRGGLRPLPPRDPGDPPDRIEPRPAQQGTGIAGDARKRLAQLPVSRVNEETAHDRQGFLKGAKTRRDRSDLSFQSLFGDASEIVVPELFLTRTEAIMQVGP